MSKLRYQDDRGEVLLWPILRDFVLLLIALVALMMWGCPTYNVWQQGLAGQAELRRAEQNRQIAVQEATAKKEAATMLAGAEIERAKGIAEANHIVANSLKGNSEYLRYLWIDKVASSPGREIIYVPTEAGLPILEASRLTLSPNNEEETLK